MKRFFLAIAMLMFVVGGFAQDAPDAIKLKNDGNDALRAKNYEKAFELFQKSIANWKEEQKDNAMIYNTGYCAYKIKNYKGAVKYFDESIKGNYKVSTAILYKANSQRLSGDPEGFETTLEAGVVKFPNNSKMKDMLATFYLKEGNAFYKKGAAILKNAANDVAAGKYKTTDPQYAKVTNEAKEQFKKALPLFEKGLKVDPNDDTAKQLKAACEQAIKG